MVIISLLLVIFFIFCLLFDHNKKGRFCAEVSSSIFKLPDTKNNKIFVTYKRAAFTNELKGLIIFLEFKIQRQSSSTLISTIMFVEAKFIEFF